MVDQNEAPIKSNARKCAQDNPSPPASGAEAASSPKTNLEKKRVLAPCRRYFELVFSTHAVECLEN